MAVLKYLVHQSSSVPEMLSSRLPIVSKLRKVCGPARKISPRQEEALKENCLLIDEEDKVIGTATKRDCHRVGEGGNLLLHRGFSVYLFNEKRELLIQKRSDSKVTFPGCFSNSCCSHPLADIEDETVETDALGVKLAAIRRLNQELGIPKEELEPEDFKYMTRIMYKSLGDGVWGEFEIAYMLILMKDVSIKPNIEEVSEIYYVSRENFDNFIKNVQGPFTAWFPLVIKYKLPLWWDNLDSLNTFMDHKNIHRLN